MMMALTRQRLRIDCQDYAALSSRLYGKTETEFKLGLNDTRHRAATPIWADRRTNTDFVRSRGRRIGERSKGFGAGPAVRHPQARTSSARPNAGERICSRTLLLLRIHAELQSSTTT